MNGRFRMGPSPFPGIRRTYGDPGRQKLSVFAFSMRAQLALHDHSPQESIHSGHERVIVDRRHFGAGGSQLVRMGVEFLRMSDIPVGK